MWIARRGCLAVGALLVVGAVGVWLLLVEPRRRHGEFYRNVRAELQSLARKRPPNVSRKQWENIVAWTINAQGNCLCFWHEFPRAEMDRFEKELKQRLSGSVTLETIDWIWDEIVRLSRNGKHYSDYYRPTRPERLKEFEESNISWGIEVD